MTVTLVIGAAASGKSAYAESLCLGHDSPRVYLARGRPPHRAPSGAARGQGVFHPRAHA